MRLFQMCIEFLTYIHYPIHEVLSMKCCWCCAEKFMDTDLEELNKTKYVRTLHGSLCVLSCLGKPLKGPAKEYLGPFDCGRILHCHEA